MTPDVDVAIVGAGVAGLTAAAALRGSGLSVVVLEQSRGLGGRAATRRRGDVRIDHGSQFFSARDPRFRTRVDAWSATGDVAVWTRGMPTWHPDDGWSDPGAHAHPRYAPPAGMSALGHLLGVGVDVRREVTVARVTAGGGAWHLDLADGTSVDAPGVLLTAPAPQARALIADVDLAPGAAEVLEAIDFDPCFAVMAGYEGAAPPSWPAVRIEGHPDLAWLAQDGSRRGPAGAGRPTVLVLHATPAFSRIHLDAPHDAVAEALLGAATALLRWADRPSWRDVHLWRYARPVTVHPERYLTAAPGLLVAGDAFGAELIEGAYLSGLAAAGALVAGLTP